MKQNEMDDQNIFHLIKITALTHWEREKMSFLQIIFNCVSLTENVWIKISLKFVSNGEITNIPLLV